MTTKNTYNWRKNWIKRINFRRLAWIVESDGSMGRYKQNEMNTQQSHADADWHR